MLGSLALPLISYKYIIFSSYSSKLVYKFLFACKCCSVNKPLTKVQVQPCIILFHDSKQSKRAKGVENVLKLVNHLERQVHDHYAHSAGKKCMSFYSLRIYCLLIDPAFSSHLLIVHVYSLLNRYLHLVNSVLIKPGLAGLLTCEMLFPIA